MSVGNTSLVSKADILVAVYIYIWVYIYMYIYLAYNIFINLLILVASDYSMGNQRSFILEVPY